MTKYENIIKQKEQNKKPIDLDAIARKYKMSVADVKSVRQMIHDAELETSLVKAVGMNSPEMKAAKEEINNLKNKIASLEECINSKDYFKDSDYQFLIDENRRLEEERNEVAMDNKKLAQQIDDQVDRLRKAGL
jgi:hypothetical protein|tara:strand:- start:116 stop:517 length:402 start_codon:yes stop_codon:yes gene_type:complete